MTALGAAEFAALMAPFAPHAPGGRVLAAVSGGADSMALAWLLRSWGTPLAVIVDHGLRADSAAEAALTRGRLEAIGVPARVVAVEIARGPDLGARARAARYAALLAACRDEGLPDLVLGHHAADQAETQVMRTRRGSGPAGRAGMAALSFRGEARVLRPLLGTGPERLRATLRAAGVGWAEDPGNSDPATARGALRMAALPPVDGAAGPARAAQEEGVAAELAARVTLHPGGAAAIDGSLSAAAWSALVWTLSGRPYPPGAAAVARLAQAGRGTLHGVLVRGGWAMREVAGPPVAAEAGAVWDGRFVLLGGVPEAEAGALDAEAGGFRGRAGLPGPVLRRLPAIRRGGKLLAVPHLHYAAAETCRSVPCSFRPARPLAGAAFVPVSGQSPAGDADEAEAHHVFAGRAKMPGTGRRTGLGIAGNE